MPFFGPPIRPHHDFWSAGFGAAQQWAEVGCCARSANVTHCQCDAHLSHKISVSSEAHHCFLRPPFPMVQTCGTYVISPLQGAVVLWCCGVGLGHWAIKQQGNRPHVGKHPVPSACLVWPEPRGSCAWNCTRIGGRLTTRKG